MLGRKGSCAGVMSAAAGMDRGRVGERLQAALAGLQELHLLKDRQSDMVSWALRMDQEEPVSSPHAEPESARMMGGEELRLEASLTALKQQLSRLRKQDVGLKTHLQQLDQQINELKLDVNKASTEQLESDSRPSSGFYELSDAGSCSRSNSCTSVYSECLSSSQTSLIPISPASCHISQPPQADVCRRRSADESTTQANPPRATGLHLGSSRIRASAIGTEQTRPRPVSTGDLDRMMSQGFGYFKSVDAKKRPVCPNLKTTPMDSKFQRNLESRSGSEVYHYPSPLHAVALQSPIFFSGGDADTPEIIEGQGATVNCYDAGHDNKTLGYIDKLLQRSLNKTQSGTGTDPKEFQLNHHRSPAEDVNVPLEAPQNDASIPRSLSTKNKSINPLDTDQRTHCMTHSNMEPSDSTSYKQLVKAPDTPHRYSYPATKEYTSDEITCSSLRKSQKHQSENARMRNPPDKKCGDNQGSRPQQSNINWHRPVVSHSSSTEESQGFELHSAHGGSPEFVHAKFVPAGSQRVRVRQADRKTKAMKLKRKSSDKSRAVRQQQGLPSGDRGREMNAGTKAEQKRSGKGKAAERVPTCHTEEHRQGSGSDSSVYSPGLTINRTVHPKQPPAAAKFNRGHSLQHLEYEHPVDPRKRRQTTPKWTSGGEMFQAPGAQRHRSKEPHAPTPRNMQMVRSMSVRAGQWMGHPRPFQASMSSSSFLHCLNARYPSAPYHVSNHYPPRCESEYSAECASLFHSTIAESSEGELSDNTTNRFGDSESSQSFHSFSDSDSSLSLDEGDQIDIHEEGVLVWAEAALGPTAAGQPIKQLPARPGPSACRIKASRALKKKIRRFQPASLKVMTLV